MPRAHLHAPAFGLRVINRRFGIAAPGRLAFPAPAHVPHRDRFHIQVDIKESGSYSPPMQPEIPVLMVIPAL